MTKHVFCDQQKNVYIKVCATEETALREISGAAAFRSLVAVPTITPLDKKTLLISSSEGEIVARNKREILNKNLIQHFSKVKKKRKMEGIVSEFSIQSELEKLRLHFAFQPGFLSVIESLLLQLKTQALFPVHGDLQVQNIFLSNNRLGFIDFEHFLIAPLELDLCNSLFFRDSNCLLVEELIPLLIRKRLAAPNNFYSMLTFYALRQIAAGRKPTEAKVRFEGGTKRLNLITGKHFSPHFFVANKNLPASRKVTSEYRHCFL